MLLAASPQWNSEDEKENIRYLYRIVDSQKLPGLIICSILEDAEELQAVKQTSGCLRIDMYFLAAFKKYVDPKIYGLVLLKLVKVLFGLTFRVGYRTCSSFSHSCIRLEMHSASKNLPTRSLLSLCRATR